MINLLLSTLAALAAGGLVYLLGVGFGVGLLLLAVVAFAGAYFGLARRTLKQLEAILLDAQREFGAARQGSALNQARIDAGLARIRDGFALSKWQLFIAGQVHAQLGMILFTLERFDEARPHLEKSFMRIGQARAMLAVLHFKAKANDKMTKAFEEAVAADKKNGLVWSTYGWCLDKLGERSKALEVLGRAVKQNPADDKLKENQKALQNNERMRMKAYGQEWWAMRLEPVPMDAIPAGMRPPQGFRKGWRTPPQTRS
jgi:tetratricopeptide (TPR) repeat protein